MQRRNLLLAATALALTACAQQGPQALLGGAPVPGMQDQGIVIASSQPEAGTTVATITLGTPDDCGGPGLGITTSTARGDKRALFDADGEPCGAATTLFDGRSALGRRAADPSVKITFHDRYGPIPPRNAVGPTSALGSGLDIHPDDEIAESLAPIPAIRVQAEPLGGPAVKETQLASISPAAGNVAPAAASRPQSQPLSRADHLTSVLKDWQQPGHSRGHSIRLATDEATAAAARDLANTTDAARSRALQEQTSRLLSELREKERQLQDEQRRHASTRAQVVQEKSELTAAATSWQQQQAQLSEQLAATRQRAQAFEALNQRLASDKEQKEKAYRQRLQTMSSDLEAATNQAQRSRQELIVAAAAKIAEAESLANAARLAEADAQAREAVRKKQEAEDMLQRALDLQNNQAVVLSKTVAPKQVAQLALLETPVVVHLKDKTLEEILASILSQAEKQAGPWKADWQFPAAQRHLLREKWSLTAEAPVESLLQNLTAQVKAGHGQTLVFTQFPQSRLLVVTLAEVAGR